MSEAEIQDGKLAEFYHRYVGEPESKRDIYGYWIFLIGTIIGMFGAGVAIIGEIFGGGPSATREIGGFVAAVGLPITLMGILVLLPVRRRALGLSTVGLAVTLIAAFLFQNAYPGSWNVGDAGSGTLLSTTSEPLIMAMYAVGIGLIAGIAVLVPIATGEKGLLVEPELGLDDDSPPILVGDAEQDAFFAVFERPDNEWGWRVIQRDAIGESSSGAPSDTDARLTIESAREKIANAGLMEITTSAFRLYSRGDGEWRWSLVQEDGGALAASDDPHPSRDDAESTVNFLKEAVPDAHVIEIRDAAFDVYQDDGDRWHWRLLDEQRTALAESSTSFRAESDAENERSQFVDLIDDPRVLTIEEIGIELFDDDNEWRWRFVDASDRQLVTSNATYDARRDAESAATDVAGRLADASTVERGASGFEVYSLGSEWKWRLRDEADDLIAASFDTVPTEERAETLAEVTGDVVDEADVIEFEGADYEVYPADGAWHWRLVADDRTVLATSTERFDDRESAEEAASRVREQSLAADLIEFEQAAFQQYESDGEWRWRLIDEDGQVMADSGESYSSKEDVMEGMTTLKENAPDAEVLEIDTAAFEIYRTEAGEYAWRLIDEGGKLIAESASPHPSRAASRDAVEYLLDTIDNATVRPMETAAFQLYGDGDAWRLWLVHTDGRVLSESDAEYATRDDAKTGAKRIRDAAVDANIATVGSVAVQLRNGSGWHWRLIDRDREPIAESNRTYESRDAALDDVDSAKRNAADAPVFELGDGIVWIERTGSRWSWQLLDESRSTVAISPDSYDSKSAVIDAVEQVQTRAPEADTIDIDTLAFERFREDGQWAWRLLDEDETVHAVSASRYDHRDDLAASIERTKADVVGASILEIDEAAFEFQEHDGGWIWRLLDEDGDPLVESVTPHDTRQQAREEMLTVKEHAPDGETVVTW